QLRACGARVDAATAEVAAAMHRSDRHRGHRRVHFRQARALHRDYHRALLHAWPPDAGRAHVDRRSARRRVPVGRTRSLPRSLYAAIRPLLFRLSPDRSHALAHAALQWSAPWQALAATSGLAMTDARLRTRFAGVDLPNPVGLAAGFDKNCELIPALSALG